MNPFVMQLIGMLVRQGLLMLFAALGLSSLVKPIIDANMDAFEQLVMGLAGAIALVGYSCYRKFKDRQKLMEALRSSQPMTEHQVEVLVKHADSFTPSVKTQKDEIPV